MLEKSVWRHYNDTNSFRGALAKSCRLNEIDMIEDDRTLYGVLKAKLTKKELKLFAMLSGGVSDAAIQSELLLDDEALEKAKFKLYKKLKQDKVRLAFKAEEL